MFGDALGVIGVAVFHDICLVNGFGVLQGIINPCQPGKTHHVPAFFAVACNLGGSITCLRIGI